MKSRHEAREGVLKTLFQYEYGSVDLEQAVESGLGASEGDRLFSFALDLVNGVLRHRGRLDEMIDRYARDWDLERIARVDLIILRMALYEMLYAPDIPAEVAIDEALNLAREYSGEDSGRFINGILGSVVSTERLRIGEGRDG